MPLREAYFYYSQLYTINRHGSARDCKKEVQIDYLVKRIAIPLTFDTSDVLTWRSRMNELAGAQN